MREILILCLMVLAGFLSACDDSNKPPANTGKYAPVLNPHPKHFFVVNGHVDTALRTTTNLVLKMTYYTSNSQCQYLIDKFAGAYSNRSITKKIFVKTDEKGSFSYPLKIDKYLPGHCHWQASGVSYTLNQSNIPGVFFSSKAKKSNNYSYINFVCYKNKLCHIANNSVFNMKNIISSKNSYQYKINVWEG